MRIWNVANMPFNTIRENKIFPIIFEFYSLQTDRHMQEDLFDLILYIPSTIFQLYRDGSSWVEPVLS